MVDTAGGLAVGAPMPAVGLRDLDGRVHDLAAPRRRPTLIFMWASW